MVQSTEATPVPPMAEGLIEFLQVVGPEWATKLTHERMTFVGNLAAMAGECRKLEEELRAATHCDCGEPYSTFCSGTCDRDE